MRTSTAYFAGVGTVVVAVAAGLGGGYLAANIANPPTPDGVQAGTQDVGGADTRLDGTSGAGAAGRGDDEPRLPRRHRNSRNRSPSSKQQPQPANRGASAISQ